jgi:hypothetical protein
MFSGACVLHYYDAYRELNAVCAAATAGSVQEMGLAAVMRKFGFLLIEP